ncbi:unnamed protein product [Zymoseptoria tritici ST99CH_1A5]|uniref:Chromo domain-containing protein n=1 Tax=Zymoseptoria tritici ST99CH_1A5 TaxID=1276529 RepID=A0A1Y6LB04_ZYMTR|nr:unnamed protein product [Zymoseptoria tritici ST99CH_1A5]
MSKGKRPVVFDSGESSEGDNDSIGTDSTAESAQLDVYPVDKILAETGAPGTDLQYLVKWEGYPLARATWEPPENITTKNVLSVWAREKRSVEEGSAKPFDYFTWFEAKGEYEQQKAERHRRRKLKRRKRGLPESPNRVDSSGGSEVDEDGASDAADVDKRNEPPTTSHERHDSAQKPVKRSVVNQSSTGARKGVARRIVKRSRVESSESSSESSEESSGESSSEDDVRGPRRRRQPARRNTANVASTSRASPRKRRDGHKGTHSQRSNSTAEPTENITREAASAKPIRVAARKSAPSGGNAPVVATRDVLANWTAPKTKRQRPRVSGDTPKDSTDPKFKNLSTQHRMQLYSRNEKEPDINALAIVDFKTGKVIQPKAKETPTAYLRRSPPPPQPPVERSTTLNEDERTRQSSGLSIQDPKRITCYFWLTRGGCAFGPDCKWAHEDTGVYQAPPDSTGRRRLDARFEPTTKNDISARGDLPRRYDANGNPIPMAEGTDWPSKKGTTCYFWQQGECQFGDAECDFAHHDTGKYAKPPPNDSRRSEAPIANENPVRPVEVHGSSNGGPGLPHRDSATRWNRKAYTCVFWQNGNCSSSDEACEFAHRDTGLYVETRLATPKETTCYYWRTKGKCEKKDHECKFAHYDTGIHASQPGTFNRGRAQMIPVVPGEIPAANSVPVAPRETIRASADPPAPPKGPSIWIAAQTGDQPGDVRTADLVASPMDMRDGPKQYPLNPTPVSRGATAFRRPSVTAETLTAELVVSCAGDEQPLQLQARLEMHDLARLGLIVGTKPRLEVDRMVVAADFEKLVFEQTSGIDEVIAFGGILLANEEIARELSDTCKNNASGFIAAVNGHTAKILIYPSDVEGWKFLDRPGMKFDGPFNFRIFKTLPSVETLLPSMEDKRLPAIAIGEDLAKLPTDTLINKNGTQEIRAVFLMLTPMHQAELEVYAAYFAALDVKVYHSGMAGAWAHFRRHHRGTHGLLMIHTDIPLWQIPGLHNFLQYGSRVFKVGGNVNDVDPGFTCERLFPIGTAVFITDDLFAHYPEEATAIIQSFVKQHKDKPDGAEFNRIVTRPGVKLWLEKLAEESQRRGRGDSRWVRLHECMCQLCPPEDEDPDDPPNPLPDSWLVSIAPELLPSFRGLWEKDPERATAFMVNWFAGWTVENAHNFRKFYIAYKPRNRITKTVTDTSGRLVEQELLDPKGWGDKYQHLAVRLAEDVFNKKLTK